MQGAAFALVVLLSALLAVWGAFLVPLRVGATPVPVGLVLALATLPLCRAGLDLLGRRTGGVVPLLVWSGVVVLLATRRREGDLVVTGSLRGLAFLVLGLFGGAVVVGVWRPPAPAASPTRRDTVRGAVRR